MARKLARYSFNFAGLHIERLPIVVLIVSKSLNSLHEVSDKEVKVSFGSLGSVTLIDDVNDPKGAGEFVLEHEGKEVLRMHFTTDGLHFPWEVPGQEVIH
mmetsp:Transcript_14912/g.12389  ORF Transcript_14912/g.12389 Transcript_14912/m.12389 type:complete len:100 (+) Transcript_14912:60-359(+)